jgi:hypothetical protein
MPRHAVSFVLALILTGSSAALASERDHATASPSTPSATETAAASSDAPAPVPAWMLDRSEKRPVALSALYGTYGTLQVLDIVSTRKAIAAGGREANPVMGAGGTTRMLMVKSVGAGVSIYMAERIWKKNRVAAVVTMAVMNGITAAVVAHNSGIAKR